MRTLNTPTATTLHQLATGNIAKAFKVAEVSEGVLYKIPQGAMVYMTADGTVAPVVAATVTTGVVTGVVTKGNIDTEGNLFQLYDNAELGDHVTVEITGKAIVQAKVTGTVLVGSTVVQAPYNAANVKPVYAVAATGTIIGIVLPKSLKGLWLAADEYPVLILSTPLTVA